MKHLTTFRIIDAIARTGSIRSAAERISQTPSAVQRRLQNYEVELGFEIFERTSKGVRLNAAGEMTIQHIRQTLAETEQLNSRIADLAGVRRGHVSIGCSHAFMPYFLPAEIARYQDEYPEVTFDVKMIEHSQAGEALESFEVDIALVIGETSVPEYEVHLAIPQRVVAIMSPDHPLAGQPNLRLRQCYKFPIALPKKGFSVRLLLERALFGKTFEKKPILQSNSFEYLKAHVAATDAITFQVKIGAPAELDDPRIVSSEISEHDVTGGMLFLGLKRSRVLPVAASRFVEQMSLSLAQKKRKLG